MIDRNDVCLSASKGITGDRIKFDKAEEISLIFIDRTRNALYALSLCVLSGEAGTRGVSRRNALSKKSISIV